VISGASTLTPEEADSFTVGLSVEPPFIPGLTASADYINIQIDNIIGPLLAQPAAEFCYDSPTYPNSKPQIGVNSCAGIQRDLSFNFTNGFVLPFYNLAGTRLDAININLDYRRDIAKLLGRDSAGTDFGELRLRGQVYYLLEYANSGDGTFTVDTTRIDGTFTRPRFSTQLTTSWSYKDFDAQFTWNWQSPTQVLSAGTPLGIESQAFTRYKGFSRLNSTLGYEFLEKYRVQFTIDNITDMTYAGTAGYYNGAYIDQIGRRWQLRFSAKY
jgi:outer membrane receptor protein involved in Fe transport